MKTMFKLAEKRYAYSGRMIRQAREKLDMNQARMAYLCGWTQPYQCRLEQNSYDTISEETMRTLKHVLSS